MLLARLSQPSATRTARLGHDQFKGPPDLLPLNNHFEGTRLKPLEPRRTEHEHQ